MGSDAQSQESGLDVRGRAHVAAEGVAEGAARRAAEPRDASLGPVLGALGLPTAGSLGHGIGLCKPCAFAAKGTCRSGAGCEFCHLCGPGEKKRRKKTLNEQAKAGQALGLPRRAPELSLLAAGTHPTWEEADRSAPRYVSTPSWAPTESPPAGQDDRGPATPLRSWHAAAPRLVALPAARHTKAGSAAHEPVKAGAAPEDGEPCSSACSTADTEETAVRQLGIKGWHLLGSPELPTAGSRGHRLGLCKPCAFAAGGACASGVGCEFCHLCGPDERKVRKAALKQRRRAEHAAAAAQRGII